MDVAIFEKKIVLCSTTAFLQLLWHVIIIEILQNKVRILIVIMN